MGEDWLDCGYDNLRARYIVPLPQDKTAMSQTRKPRGVRATREEQRLRRQATEQGFELNVYVPLGLVERKQKQRRGGDVPLEEVYQLTQEVITKEYDNDKFLTEVIEPGKSRRIAIIGEPGAGKLNPKSSPQ